MPLLIHIRKGKKIFINGAVVENASERTITFLLKNQAEILRCDDVLAPDDAVTPASRVYLALQCLYLFPDNRAHYLALFHDLTESYCSAAPSASDLVGRLRTLVRAGQFYEAIKLARELIAHEAHCLSALEDRSDGGNDRRPEATAAAPARARTLMAEAEAIPARPMSLRAEGSPPAKLR